MSESAPPHGVRLGVQDLTMRYGSADEATISGLTHSFRTGATTILTGASGSGKSTLLYLLGLMLTPSGGSVLWNGDPVSGLTDGERSALRRRSVGFVFQDAILDRSRTALANVLEAGWLAGLSHHEGETRGQALLERFGVAHRAQHRPAEISGGQAQRIALCRALVKEPTVILADEPTGNLDPISAEVVWHALGEQARQGATVVVATHDASRITDADDQLRLGYA